MENDKSFTEYLEYAIQSSYKEFFDKGLKNEKRLEDLISTGLYHLYTYGKADRFANKHTAHLESSFDKNEMLNFIVNRYMQTILEKQEEELVGSLEKAVKKTENEKGEEVVQQAISLFITEADPSSFSECEKDEDEFKKYSQEELVKIMCLNTVKRVISSSNLEIASLQKYDTNNKGVFTPAEFAVIANGEKDIDKVVSAMEAIRSGRIQNLGMSAR